MAALATLPALLDSLTKSLSSALEAAPKLSTIESPKDGISLLDVKNELLLSYLQNLVFLILLKLRQTKNGGADGAIDAQSLDDLVVKKLVELRLYLEKGTRPLEDKLRYQIDKMLRAADDAERNAKAAEEAAKANESDSESNDEEGSDSEGSGAEDNFSNLKASKIPGLQHRPNLAGFVQEQTITGVAKSADGSGVYKPPRIAATSMPTTERREKKERRKEKAAVMDEFVAEELSAVPVAQPSIGTTIVAGGRKMKTASERREEEERRTYEESNFVRLPAVSKKDRAKRAKAEGGTKRMNFGGEEWRDISTGVDRIHRLTQGKSSGKGTKSLLEKSRKRGLETSDGPRGDGGNMGERYQKRLKVLETGRGTRGKGR
ncbi:Sas10/Utp3/C1D family-domain-containing protein [Cercophora newfieldiana]|uniref:Sas10/Utp3/C1D family-domain-containing protein n=1 Tax=Cercophora newfieldiana TaxID=92897 RepID=A0AA39Y2F0_9PEZI|nr:Sas10/Utp3/C1D family-domain-containing protein [Cercophora newfieldiana]